MFLPEPLYKICKRKQSVKFPFQLLPYKLMSPVAKLSQKCQCCFKYDLLPSGTNLPTSTFLKILKITRRK